MENARKKSENGFALVLTLIALFLLTAVTIAMMFDANVETGINANYRSSQAAYFAARAGLEEARDRLLTKSVVNASGVADPLPTPTGLPITTAKNVIYLTNPYNGESVDFYDRYLPLNSSTLNPYFDDELCREHFSNLSSLGSGPVNVSCKNTPIPSTMYSTVASDSPGTNTSTAMPYKWVRISFKENDSDGLGSGASTWVSSGSSGSLQVCWDGNYETVACDPLNQTTEPVYVLTSMAVTPNHSRALLQAEVALSPPVFVKGAVVSNSGVNFNGNLQISGNDACTCASPMSNNPTPLTSGGTCNTLAAVYSHSTTVPSPNGSESIYGGQPNASPTVPAIQGGMPFNYNVPLLVQEFSNSPGAVNCTNGCSSWGTSTNPGIFIVNGDLSESGHFAGDGILVVTGNLTLHGGTDWTGLIIVEGTSDMSGGGSVATNLTGAILTAGTSSIDTTLGGSYNLQYNSCAIANAMAQVPPAYITFRQLDYY